MTADTSEKGLETLICQELAGNNDNTRGHDETLVGGCPAAFSTGWMMGDASD